jgi:hypothetical protein
VLTCSPVTTGSAVGFAEFVNLVAGLLGIAPWSGVSVGGILMELMDDGWRFDENFDGDLKSHQSYETFEEALGKT